MCEEYFLLRRWLDFDDNKFISQKNKNYGGTK